MNQLKQTYIMAALESFASHTVVVPSVANLGFPAYQLLSFSPNAMLAFAPQAYDQSGCYYGRNTVRHVGGLFPFLW